MAHFGFSNELGRKFRNDPVESLGVSTLVLLRRAINEPAWTEAQDLLAYFRHEVSVVNYIYADWLRDMFDDCEAQHGPGAGKRLVSGSAGQWYALRYAGLFGQDPEGTFARLKTRAYADEYEAPLYEPLQSAIDHKETRPALQFSESYRAGLQRLQALYTDWCWAVMTYAAQTYGEEEVGRLIYDTAKPWFRERYDRYFRLPPEQQLQLTVEGMRGHLCGPGRIGTVEVADEGDRWRIAFDPCGSGGAMRRGDAQTGDPPRTATPYLFGATSKPFDWSWGGQGVCYYCAHCAIINEQLPIDVYGHPIRVTEYPEQPGDKCCWVVYKDPANIPGQAYTRVGRSAPGPSSLPVV